MSRAGLLLRLSVSAALVLVGLGTTGATSAPVEPASYVDPMIGTAGSGFMVPGATTPFGMVQVSPDTEGQLSPFAYTGYQFHDATIRGFSVLHESGPGVHMGGDLPFMPVVGPVLSTDPLQYMVPFSHAAESATAGAYSVTLANGVQVDLAATPRVGLERFAFPGLGAGSVIAAAGRSNSGTHPATVAVVGEDRLEGSMTDPNFGGGFTVHFSVRFSRAFDSFSTYVGGTQKAGERKASGEDAGAVLGFPAGDPVTLSVGVSFVDLAGARAAIAREAPKGDVAAAQAAAWKAWNDVLGRVVVTGGSLPDLRTFYTALYHASLHPNVFSDVDGRYRGQDKRVHRTKHVEYANFSLWDTARGQNALLALLHPDRYRDMARSLYNEYAQSGKLPKWSLWNTAPNYMNGDPAIQFFAEGACRGLFGAKDLAAYYAAMRKLAFEQRNPEYLTQGWLALETASTAVSDTLENADADFALALVADRLGRRADAATLLRRSAAWKHLLDPETKFLRPRHKDGSWLTPFDPQSDVGYKEGTAWQYLWLVPHDIAGLAAAQGGAAPTIKRLDQFFSEPVTGLVTAPVIPAVQSGRTVFGIVYQGDQYVPGNEHDLQAPYLYNWVGAPAQTQGVLASERSLFNPTPLGLPGNDDLGSLSAWYIWSALGAYPTVQGSPITAIGTPLFPHVELRLPGGAMTIDAPGASSVARYVEGVTVDGRAHDRSWFDRSAWAPGRRIAFTMSNTPTTWAAGSQPPSASTSSLGAFGCR